MTHSISRKIILPLTLLFIIILSACGVQKGEPGNYYKLRAKMDQQDWVNTDFGHYSIIKTDDYILMGFAWVGEHGVERGVGFYWYGETSSAYIESYTFNGSSPECTWKVESKGLGPVNQYIADGYITYMNKSLDDNQNCTDTLNAAIVVLDKRFKTKYGIGIA